MHQSLVSPTKKRRASRRGDLSVEKKEPITARAILAQTAAQFAAACLPGCVPALAADGLEIEDTGALLIVTGTLGAGFRVIFEKAAGTIVSFVAANTVLLDSPGPLPNLWRAPTDNDEGGGSNSYATAWIAMGLQRTRMTNISFSYTVDELVGAVVVTVSASLPILIPSGSFRYTSTFTIRPTAEIDMTFDWLAQPVGAAEFPALARMGVQFLVPRSYGQLTWYGRGPFERYSFPPFKSLFGGIG